jgi:hypothetical protein
LLFLIHLIIKKIIINTFNMKRSIGIAILMSIGFLTKAQDAPKPPSIEDRLKHTKEVIEKDLQLTPAQEKQLVQAYTDFFNDMDQLHKNAPPPPPPPPPPMDPKVKEQFDKLVKERDDKMKQVLNEDQYKKYLEATKKLHPHHHEGKDGAPPPPPPPPSSE